MKPLWVWASLKSSITFTVTKRFKVVKAKTHEEAVKAPVSGESLEPREAACIVKRYKMQHTKLNQVVVIVWAMEKLTKAAVVKFVLVEFE